MKLKGGLKCMHVVIVDPQGKFVGQNTPCSLGPLTSEKDKLTIESLKVGKLNLGYINTLLKTTEDDVTATFSFRDWTNQSSMGDVSSKPLSTLQIGILKITCQEATLKKEVWLKMAKLLQNNK